MTAQYSSPDMFVRPLDGDRPTPTVACAGATSDDATAIDESLTRRIDAIETVRQTDPDAVVDTVLAGDVDCVVAHTDIERGDGLALLQRIREVDEAVPVVLVVAEGSERFAADAVNAGADGYVCTDAEDGARLGGEEGDLDARLADRVETVVEEYRTRQDVRNATRLLGQLTGYTSEALWMFSADWTESQFVNAAYEDIFGASIESVAAEPESFLENVHPADRQRVTEGMERLSGGETVEIEFRVNEDEDFGRWVSVHAEPTRDESGAIENVAGYTRDVTTRKQQEDALEEYKEELERSNESLREFAYIASHDLQEPLRMVSSYVDLLEQEYGDQLDGDAEEYMAFASDGARRMKQMINSLLEYSRVHSDAGEVTRVDAGAVVDDARQDLELLVDEHDAAVHVGDLPTVPADRDQLGQVFQNLIKNAIEHSDGRETPTVEVSGSAAADAYRFEVSDNGPGVGETDREQIFEIFSQGGNAANGSSTGIGLAVTRRIIHRHGGEIWVADGDGDAEVGDTETGDSEDGATFVFTIPRSDGETDDVTMTPHEHAPGGEVS
jgi:PAS domain S-box-containing protein